MIGGTEHIHFWTKDGEEYRPMEIHILFKGMEERLMTSPHWPKAKKRRVKRKAGEKK